MNFAAEQSSSGPLNLLLLLAIPVVFYFLLIRPQSKRRKEQLQMQNSLRPGVRVMTTSGMYATVVAVDDDGVVLEIAPGVEARFVKQAVMQVVAETDGADDELDDDAGDSGGSGDPDDRIDLSKKDAGDAEDGAKEAEDAETEEGPKAKAAGKTSS
jgi:preprotein translocase subunit YajC